MNNQHTITDRTDEVLENIELMIGNILSNNPLVIKHDVLSTRCNRILNDVRTLASDIMVYKASEPK